MKKEDNVASYFIKISKIRDQLQGVGKTISDSKLITTVINALPKTCDGFVGDIYARKETPTFQELWDACTSEESRLKAKSNTQPHNEDS